MEGQTKSVHELYQDIQNIQNEQQGWKKAYENLELEKERIYEEMVLAVNQRENETQVLHKTSKQLVHRRKIKWELVHTREKFIQL